MSEQSAPPLLLDAMLGRLARWLRLMGYDARFIADTDDLVLVRVAKAESRLLLTRDGPLARRRGVQTLFIHSQDVNEQVAQVLREIGRPPEPVTPRCAGCNAPLESLSKEAARERVPPYVWRAHDSFTHCPECRRVYWKGTHWQGIQRQIEQYNGGPGDG